MKNIKTILVVIISLIILISCSKKDNETEKINLQNIYEKNGIPVKVENIERSKFENHFLYDADLKAYENVSEYSGLSSHVEKVNFEVGDYVKEGQVVVQFPSDNPSAKFKQAEAAFLNSKKTYERMKSLFKVGGVSKQDLENVKTQFDVNKANFNAVKSIIKVEAPISGIITELEVSKKTNVNPGDLLFTVADFEKLRSTIYVSQADIDKISDGLKATALVNNKQIEGKVVKTSLNKNQKRMGYSVEIEFENKDKIRRTGLTAQISITVYQKNNVFAVPINIIKKRNNQNYVMLVENGKVKEQLIEVGAVNTDKIEVMSGLYENAKLIIEGFDLVNENDKVKITN